MNTGRKAVFDESTVTSPTNNYAKQAQIYDAEAIKTPNVPDQSINMYFRRINTDSSYTAPVPLSIPEGTRLPKVSIYSVVNLLLKQKPTAAGPDDLPYWF